MVFIALMGVLVVVAAFVLELAFEGGTSDAQFSFLQSGKSFFRRTCRK